MTAWILGVLGSGVLGAVVSHLTSGTRVHKAVKTACIYVFILAVIFPVPVLASGEWKALSCDFENVEYDEKIADVTDEAYFSLVSEALDGELSGSGYDTETVIQGTVYSSNAIIDSVTITVFGEYADSSAEILRIKDIAAEYLEIDLSLIYVYVE